MALALQSIALSLHGATLIKPFDLRIAAGEVVTLMGPSGAGKSALLSLIAGDLEPPFAFAGTVTLNGTDLTQLQPEARHAGRLFQDDLLFPHMTVAENLLFGMPRGDRAVRLGRMEEALASAGLAGFGDRPPHTLSGGQRARVALMRALVAAPRAMLLDEPFNRLDAELRDTTRRFVFDHLKDVNIPCLMVTHDRADAPPGGRVLRLANTEVSDD